MAPPRTYLASTYLAIDLKSFYASVECVDRHLDPLTTNLVVADASRTEKTICLAVSPSLKAYKIPGRARLFEAVQRVREVNAQRLQTAIRQKKAVRGEDGKYHFASTSFDANALNADPTLGLSYIVAPPRMQRYLDVSTQIYKTYLKYVSPADIYPYSIDEVFIDVTGYLPYYHMSAHELAMTMVREVLYNTGITATAGIGTNLYLAKLAMDIVAKHIPADKDGVRIAELDEQSYRYLLWNHRPLTDFWMTGPGTVKRLVNALAEQKASQQVNSLQLTGNRADKDYPDPPEMPKKLPKLVELLISRTPEIYKPAVAHAIFPPLATHLWKTRFRYIDNVEHEARLMTLLLAGTGAGKSSVNRPIDFIMEDIRLRDAENLKREKAWKDEMLRKGANKDKRKRPENLIIQEIDADMTNPAFVMRTAEAQEHFLYTSLNELDQFDALKGSGSQQFRIMCLAADPGNKYGQTRVGTMSVTERVTIRFNWNASTTIQKGQRYFSKVLTDGPISRINFCTIPEREIGEDMPVYGTYDESYREALRPYIDNLNKVTGLIECKEAFQLALKLKDENAEFARLSQDRTFENLSFRANVIAYLKACVLYVANGCKWEPEIDEFIRWSEQYDLYCKMRFFGDMIAKENFMAQRSSKRGPQNLLQILPDNFTAAQLLAIRLEHGLDAKGTDMMIRQWLHRNYIRRAYQYTGKRDSCDSCDSFEKLKYRHDGMVIKS